MKRSTIWIIAVCAGIPATLILIGLIVLLIKFLLKRCRTKAWHDIRTLPKATAQLETNGKDQRKFQRLSSERQPLYVSTSPNDQLDSSDLHLTIPVDDKDRSATQRTHLLDEEQRHDQTLVQIQRERLNRIKDEENRLRPMIRLSHGENEIHKIIDQTQREFDEMV